MSSRRRTQPHKPAIHPVTPAHPASPGLGEPAGGNTGAAATSTSTGAGTTARAGGPGRPTGRTGHRRPPDGRRTGRPAGRSAARGDRARPRAPEPGSRRALRREMPSAVALLADPGAFTAMRRYRSFTFTDHRRYLRQMDRLLHTLADQGVHLSVGLFDPEEFADWCADTGRDPDSADSRTHYTAALVAGGPTLPYDGRPIGPFTDRLVRHTAQQDAREHATDLLHDAPPCPDCGEDLAPAAVARATSALTHLLDLAGPGTHHLVCSVAGPEGPLLAALAARHDPGGEIHVVESDALTCVTVLAAGFATSASGGVVLRTLPPDGSAGTGTGRAETVRGWAIAHGWLAPLTAAEVFDAYCTDARTGEPVPPEPGVSHLPGHPLPPPPPDPHHDHP